MPSSVRSLVLTLTLAGCSSSDRTSELNYQATPPVGTGAVATSFDGTWIVTGIERIDGSGLPLPPAFGSTQPFLPVEPGQQLTFVDDRAVDAGGTPLYERYYGEPTPYLNVADDRVWLFLVQGSGLCSSLYLSAAFGTVDVNTLEGTVDVGIGPGSQPCIPTNWIVADPSGTFRVVLSRAPLPVVGDR